MSKNVTLELDDATYHKLVRQAEDDNRSLENYLQTAIARYIEAAELVDEFEMAEILGNQRLMESLQKGHEDASAGRGAYVE